MYGSGGKLKTGYHYDYEMDTPMANLVAVISLTEKEIRDG
jgi:hypothetical protein